MAFPPEFSSTETYANRYDLDEIDVFLEGNANNPMFFNIQGLSKTFAFGKHYFTISILESMNQFHKLKGGSRVLFEFKSINNVVLKSDVQKIDLKNGLITCFFEILKDPKKTYKEVQDGQGTFIIAANLEDKDKTIVAENSIPNNFKNAINYRCVYPINIRKNALNADSPVLTNLKHTKKTIAGAFPFTESSLPASNDSGADYDGTGLRLTPGVKGALGTTD